jgi:hypothetical protein
LYLLLPHCFFGTVETVAGLGVLATETAGADKKVLWDIGTWLAVFEYKMA